MVKALIGMGLLVTIAVSGVLHVMGLVPIGLSRLIRSLGRQSFGGHSRSSPESSVASGPPGQRYFFAALVVKKEAEPFPRAGSLPRISLRKHRVLPEPIGDMRLT